MTLNRLDVSPLNLDGSITTAPALDLAHDEDLLSEYGILNTLRDLDEAEVITPDFPVSGSTHELHVWEVDAATSTLSKWSRGTGCSVSGARAAMDADIIVVAVPPGVSVPSEPPQSGPPAPGTTQKKVRVKIAKQGDMPITS
jgi:hypothetical protein